MYFSGLPSMYGAGMVLYGNSDWHTVTSLYTYDQTTAAKVR